MSLKNINATFTLEEHRQLKEIKGGRTWEQAILEEFGIETERQRHGGAADGDDEPDPELAVLMDIQWIGKNRAQTLLDEFGDLEGVIEAVATDPYRVAEVPGFTPESAYRMARTLLATDHLDEAALTYDPTGDPDPDLAVLVDLPRIGEKRARMLLDEFGDLDGVLDAIATDPYRISEVPGFTPESTYTLARALIASGRLDEAELTYDPTAGPELAVLMDIPRIGEQRARTLLDAFGDLDAVLDAIATEPERVGEVSGFTTKSAYRMARKLLDDGRLDPDDLAYDPTTDPAPEDDSDGDSEDADADAEEPEEEEEEQPVEA